MSTDGAGGDGAIPLSLMLMDKRIEPSGDHVYISREAAAALKRAEAPPLKRVPLYTLILPFSCPEDGEHFHLLSGQGSDRVAGLLRLSGASSGKCCWAIPPFLWLPIIDPVPGTA